MLVVSCANEIKENGEKGEDKFFVTCGESFVECHSNLEREMDKRWLDYEYDFHCEELYRMDIEKYFRANNINIPFTDGVFEVPDDLVAELLEAYEELKAAS